MCNSCTTHTLGLLSILSGYETHLCARIGVSDTRTHSHSHAAPYHIPKQICCLSVQSVAIFLRYTYLLIHFTHSCTLAICRSFVRALMFTYLPTLYRNVVCLSYFIERISICTFYRCVSVCLCAFHSFWHSFISFLFYPFFLVFFHSLSYCIKYSFFLCAEQQARSHFSSWSDFAKASQLKLLLLLLLLQMLQPSLKDSVKR